MVVLQQKLINISAVKDDKRSMRWVEDLFKPDATNRLEKYELVSRKIIFITVYILTT